MKRPVTFGNRKGLQTFVHAETKVVDMEKGEVEAWVSSEAKDRDGDIIRQAFWDLSNFEKHPVLVSSHNYRDLTAQMGIWRDMEVSRKKLGGIAVYNLGEGNEQAEAGFRLAVRGQAAFSVGFIPDMKEARELTDSSGSFWPNYEFRGQELLEVSQVTIPSNADALQRMLKDGHVDPDILELLEDELRSAGAAGLDDPDGLADHIVAVLEKRLPRLIGPLLEAAGTAAVDEYVRREAEAATLAAEQAAEAVDDDPAHEADDGADPWEDFDPAATAERATATALDHFVEV